MIHAVMRPAPGGMCRMLRLAWRSKLALDRKLSMLRTVASPPGMNGSSAFDVQAVLARRRRGAVGRIEGGCLALASEVAQPVARIDES